jgi:hypothetical protein
MTSHDFLRAFEKNCPNVRMTKDERVELSRLFFECWKCAQARAKVDAAKREVHEILRGASRNNER